MPLVRELRARSTAKAQSAAIEEWQSFATVIETSIMRIAVRSRPVPRVVVASENQTPAVALPNLLYEITRYSRVAKLLGRSRASLCSSMIALCKSRVYDLLFYFCRSAECLCESNYANEIQLVIVYVKYALFI